MAKDNITPEEKLLKIIESPDVEKRRIPVAMRMKSMRVSSPKDWLNNFHLDKDSLKKFNLKLINKIIAAACALITFIWALNFLSTGIKLSKRFEQMTSVSGSSVQEGSKRPGIDINVDEAVTQVKRRNIFTLLPSKEEAQAAVNIGLTLGNLKLVGILWSDNPQAMIENTKEQKTYFVSKGDKIGDVEVRNILRDRVVVGRDTEEWDLR